MTNEELNTDNSRYQIPLGSGLRKVERKKEKSLMWPALALLGR